MKKSLMFLFAFAFILVSLNPASAAVCDLDVSLINQDPYPAIPGDYIRLVFQIDGVDNPECGNVQFELLEQYPLKFDPDTKRIYDVDAGIYNKDFNSYLLAPYKVRIDEDALEGDNPIEIQYKHKGNQVYLSEKFDINIEDSKADFEIYVKDYVVGTGIITFEILNIADSDIEALTIELPSQEGVIVKGAKTNIVGDLDSNEFTTADFEATPQKGDINLKISYSDANNVRRNLEKQIYFEPEYFQGRVSDEKNNNGIIWVILIALVILYFLYRRHKKKKAMKNKLKRK